MDRQTAKDTAATAAKAAVDASYGENMLHLTFARGYIKKLLDNAKVVRFLNANHADILAEFEAMAAAETACR